MPVFRLARADAPSVRLALGLKGIPWKSVEAPMICPKPDLSALTGGYERIPVLQIGADIYCDTDCITQVLEAHQPAPSLYPAPLGKAGRMIARVKFMSTFPAWDKSSPRRE